MSTKSIPGSAWRSIFPSGLFRGTIAESAYVERDDGSSASVNFQLVKNSAIDADKEPGDRPHFVRLPVWMDVTDQRGRKETLLVYEVDLSPDAEGVPFPLRQAGLNWAALAMQLGQAHYDSDGNVQFDSDMETFIEEFKEGEYNGEEVEFVVTHRPEKKGGKVVKGGRTFVNTDFPRPEDNEDEEEEEDEDETVDEPEEEEEEEEPAPKPKRRTVKGKSKPRGSGKGKFVRRKK